MKHVRAREGKEPKPKSEPKMEPKGHIKIMEHEKGYRVQKGDGEATKHETFGEAMAHTAMHHGPHTHESMSDVADCPECSMED